MAYLNKHRTKWAFIIIVALLLTMLLTSLFVHSHHDHECSGSDCEICCQLHNAKYILKQLLSIPVWAVGAASYLLIVVRRPLGMFLENLKHLSCLQKVRLNC